MEKVYIITKHLRDDLDGIDEVDNVIAVKSVKRAKMELLMVVEKELSLRDNLFEIETKDDKNQKFVDKNNKVALNVFISELGIFN
ncbi:hypothetical protein RJG79_08605 [Mycoplasmatota bacterium WC44]